MNARCQLCRGMLRMMFITHSLKLVDRQPMKHTTWEKKFDQRFRAFQVGNIAFVESLNTRVSS